MKIYLHKKTFHMLNQGLILELKHEAASTKKILERVPIEKLDWQPHAKSTSIGRLALHVARLPFWITKILQSDGYDAAQSPFPAYKNYTSEELVKKHLQYVDESIAALETATTADFDAMWKFTMHGNKIFELPRKAAIRNMAYNHLVHHRGQLSVYLRLLDIPVPGMYGPTADEK
jgi:uncharacterized damage-inducible protein DinB